MIGKEMKYILVVGSRSITDYEYIKNTLDKYCNSDTVIVSGGAKGVDTLAERYADENNLQKVIMKADWDGYGKRAGYIRNAEMHKFISGKEDKLCIAFWDGNSKGTAHNFNLAKQYNNPIIVLNDKEKEISDKELER